MRGSHIKLGEGERKVRLGQDSLPNKVETSGDYIHCFTRTHFLGLELVSILELDYTNSLSHFKILSIEQRIFAFSFIIEGTTKKVLQFIIPLKVNL